MLQKCTSSLVNYSLKEKSLPIVFFVSSKVRFGEKKAAGLIYGAELEHTVSLLGQIKLAP